MKNERQTRKELIDTRLKQAGWNVSDRTQVVEEFDIEVGIPEGVVREPDSPYQGHQFSDYVLLGKDGKPMAVIEAKKTAADAAIGGKAMTKQDLHTLLEDLCTLPRERQWLESKLNKSRKRDVVF